MSDVISSEELRDIMSHATGTETYWRSRWGLTYTDGVKTFAEKAGAYWFIDEIGIAFHLYPKIRKDFLSIILNVEDYKACIVFEDGDKKTIKKQKINFTDCPAGVWKFYLIDGVLMYHKEY